MQANEHLRALANRSDSAPFCTVLIGPHRDSGTGM